MDCCYIIVVMYVMCLWVYNMVLLTCSWGCIFTLTVVCLKLESLFCGLPVGCALMCSLKTCQLSASQELFGIQERCLATSYDSSTPVVIFVLSSAGRMQQASEKQIIVYQTLLYGIEIKRTTNLLSSATSSIYGEKVPEFPTKKRKNITQGMDVLVSKNKPSKTF